MAQKKLIEFGLDCPSIQFVRENIRSMEEKPFDGIVMVAAGHLRTPISAGTGPHHALYTLFSHKPYPEETFAPVWADAQEIRAQKFTHNFLLAECTPEDGWDWFDEADWEAAQQNIRYYARTIHTGGFHGLFIDPRIHSPAGLWAYSALQAGNKTKRSFDDYAWQTRLYGARFMQILQEEQPGVRVFWLHLAAALPAWPPDRTMENRKDDLAVHPYGLLPWFAAGMLDTAAAGVEIIDGNDPAFFHTRPSDYYRDAERIHFDQRQTLEDLAPGAGKKYGERLRLSFPVFFDYIMKPNRINSQWFNGRRPFFGSLLSSTSRLLWLEHNTCYALTCADEYAWWYSEDMDWWQGDVPDGVQETVAQARSKAVHAAPFDFDERVQHLLQQAQLATER